MQGFRPPARQGQPTPRSGRSSRPQPVQAKQPKVVVPRIDLLADAGSVLAVLDALLVSDQVTLKECQLHRDPHNGIYWVSPPLRSYQRHGETRYRPLIDWPKHYHQAILAAALAAYREKTASGQIGGAA